jgi:hypothetical protein
LPNSFAEELEFSQSISPNIGMQAFQPQPDPAQREEMAEQVPSQQIMAKTTAIH